MQKSCACNFLYGQKTDPLHRGSISRALEQKQELKLEVILYKSSGTPFWCLLDIVPIQDEKHEVVLFLCSHKDITKQKLHEQQQQQQKQRIHLAQQHQTSDCHPPEHQESHSVQLNYDNQPEPIGGKHASDQVHLGAATDDSGANKTRSNDIHPNAAHSTGLQTNDTDDDNNDSAQLQQQQQYIGGQDSGSRHALISIDEFGLSNEEMNADDGDLEFDGDESDDNDKHTANQYSRRRSRAVLYQLSGHYGYRRSVNMKSKLKLNNRMNIPEYKTTTIEKQKFILLHYGLGKSCWDWLILVVTFYVAIVVPYNATFKAKQELGNSIDCKVDSTDIIVEIIFLIDVLLNLRTTYVNRKGEVVTRPKSIMRHYFRTWFVVDACAALPIDFLCGRFQSRVDLNLVKLIRLLRLARLLQKMDRYSQYSYIILTMLMLIFSLLAHWCACIWYVIAMAEIEHNPPDWKIGWLHQLADKLGYISVNATDMASSYVTALYFTTSSLTSVGFGNVSANTNAEKIFSIVIMLIGALMHAVVFGNVTALIRVMYARRSNYQTRLRDLKDFFRLHQVPKELQQRMNDYFQTTWSLNHGIDSYEILKDFPEELRGDVSLHLHREVLSLPIFETAPQGFLKSLARHIESKFCCPTEFLIHRGDALNYLYLVCNGSMEVLQDNMVVAILGKGDLVGYDVSANLTPEHTQFGLASSKSSPLVSQLVKSSSDLKALTYCDLKCIHISGLLEVLKLYPEFSDTFHDEIIHDLSFNLRETNHDERNEDQAQFDDNNNNQIRYDDNPDDEPDEAANTSGAEPDDDANFAPSPRGRVNGRRASPPPPHVDHLYKSMRDSRVIGRYDHQTLEETETEANDELEDEADDEDEEHSDNGDDDDDDDDDDNNNGGTDNIRDRRDDDEGDGRGRGGASGPSSSSNNDNNNNDNYNTRGQPTDPNQNSPGEPTSSDAKAAKTLKPIMSSSRHQPATASVDCGASTRLKSAIGGSSAGRHGNRKPPISFDLRHEHATIAERRRRSVGCIARAPQQANKLEPLSGHSSLQQINASSAQAYQTGAPLGPQLNARPARPSKRKGSSSELRSIDERISAISSSLGEMSEKLNNFQLTLCSMHEVFIQQIGANNCMPLSSPGQQTSFSSSSATNSPTVLAHTGHRLTRNINKSKSGSSSSSADQPKQPAALARSQSSASLLVRLQQGRLSRPASILHEPAMGIEPSAGATSGNLLARLRQRKPERGPETRASLVKTKSTQSEASKRDLNSSLVIDTHLITSNSANGHQTHKFANDV